jgi:hypothetical protein
LFDGFGEGRLRRVDRSLALKSATDAFGSSTTGEVLKAADRFELESRHRCSNGCSVTLT